MNESLNNSRSVKSNEANFSSFSSFVSRGSSIPLILSNKNDSSDSEEEKVEEKVEELKIEEEISERVAMFTNGHISRALS